MLIAAAMLRHAAQQSDDVGTIDSMSRRVRIVIGLLSWTLLVSVIAALIFAGLFYFGVISHFFGPKRSELYTSNFTATARHYAFLYELKRTGEQIVVAYDTHDKVLAGYGVSSAFISPPWSSLLQDAVYIASAKKGLTPDKLRAGIQLENALYKCELVAVRCSKVFQNDDGSIGSIVDFPNGDLIFTSAKPVILGTPQSKEFVRYRNFDFYLRRADGDIERLTEWDAAVLTSVGLGRDKLVFQLNPRWQTPAKPKSQIYAALLSPERRITGLATEDPQPFIAYGKNVDIAPSISPDGSKTAFESSSESQGRGWRYDIVIIDNDSKKPLHTIVPEPETDLSRPKFVDETRIRFMSSDGRHYKFREFDLSTGKETVLGEVSAEDIQKAKIHDLAAQD